MQGLDTNKDYSKRSDIIEENSSIISRVYYKLTGKYLHKSEDEYSIGLLAIDEAMDRYDSSKGTKFSSFCHTVIHGRLIDHLRKKKREIPFSEFENQEEGTTGLSLVEQQQGILAHETYNRTQIIREEIAELNEILSKYNIDFYHLPNISPKHKDTRENLVYVAKEIVKHKEILDKINKKNVLPIKQVELVTGVKSKTLERHRKYILVLCIILSKDFDYLKEYI